MFARRRIATGLLAAIVAAVAVTPADAQGLFGFLFGRRSAPPLVSYAPPPLAPLFGERAVDPSPAPARGPSVSYCVRTCDGRFFPMPRHAGVTPAQLCNSFCPAAKTTIMYGSAIDHARSNDGARYAELPNAYLYRQKVVDNCTCNGKDPMGLASIAPTSDPTLRSGDIVATEDGLAQYNGKGPAEAANYTPVDAAKLSAGMRKKLAGIEVTENPTLDEAKPLTSAAEVSAARDRAGRSAQLSR